MKISALHWLAFTFLFLITVIIFVAINLPFSWVFYLSIVGQGMFVFMVYKVLRDNYDTNKTFKDLYEDGPNLRDINYR